MRDHITATTAVMTNHITGTAAVMTNHTNGTVIANEIRMTRSQYSGSFLIVEGEVCDLRVYGLFSDPESCRVIPAHGKDNATDALRILEQDHFEGVLAIVDADFWLIDGIDARSPNLLLTDTHDLETMILESPALEKVLAEFGSPRKIARITEQRGTDVRGLLLCGACWLGRLRWVSQQNRLALCFQDLPYRKFIDPHSLNLNVAAMINRVKGKSGKLELREDDLRDAINAIAHFTQDPWNACCGHDLVGILSFGLRKAIGTNNTGTVKRAVIEKSLRLAYDFAYFSATRLYSSVQAWERANLPFRVFRNPAN